MSNPDLRILDGSETPPLVHTAQTIPSMEHPSPYGITAHDKHIKNGHVPSRRPPCKRRSSPTTPKICKAFLSFSSLYPSLAFVVSMTPGVLGTSHTIANSSILGERQTIRGLPSKCYTSPDLYEVERRAIFSRKWQILTHSSRFPGVGDYLKYDIAGFEILLVKNRDNEINGFHNICRHRAFPVVTEDKGTARILSCKYHGWSYGLNGKLAKAPSYQDIPGFDKSRNSLFPIHVHIDQRGFAWVNLDGKATPEIEWEDDFSGTDESSSIDYSEYEFDHHREMSGSWNWKILADNYNGCYHCPTAQPSTSEPTSEQLDRCSIIRNSSSSSLTQAYHFPNASTTTT